MRLTQTGRPYLALVTGLAAISLSAMFIRWAAAPGTVTTFYRMAIASLVLAPFAVRGLTRAKLPPAVLLFGVAGGLFTALDQGIWSVSLGYTSIANASLLNNIAPLWVALFTWLFWKQRLERSFWWGLALTLIGASIVFGSDFLRTPQLNRGDLLALVSSLAYGGYFLVGQSGRRRMSALSYVWIMSLSAAAILLIWNLGRGEALTGFPPRTYLAFLGAAVISQVIGHFCITYALGGLPAAVVSPSAVAQPVVTALLAIPLANEPLSAGQWIGGAITLFGIYQVNKRRPAAAGEPAKATTSPAA
ncbi:MAG TPA: DMT family transporter [Anaerolineaceae bacterium]|nr:DMT family transporter [Anaerolineaceae bacterium]